MSTSLEGIRLKAVWVASAFGVLLTLLIVLATVVLFYEYRNRIEAAPGFAAQPDKLNALRADQLEKLNSFGVVDAEKEVYSIPIQQAMADIVKEPPSAKGVSSTKIEPEPAAAATAPAPAEGSNKPATTSATPDTTVKP